MSYLKLLNRRNILLFIILLILTAIGFRLYRDLERYEKTVVTPPSGLAVRDPYLAFRRWMEQSGVELSYGSANDLTDGYDDYDVIFLDTRYLSGNPEAQILWKSLQSWLSAGGELRIFLNDEYQNEFSSTTMDVLNKHGLEVIHISDDNGIIDGRLIQSDKIQKTVSVDPETVLQFIALPEILSYIEADDGDGYHLVSLSIGKGRLILTGAPVFLENQLIGELDNADLAWELVGGRSGGKPVLFLMRGEAGGPFQDKPWLPVLVRSWIITAAMLIWRLLVRRESMSAPPPQSGSDIKLRLAAEGAFFWHHGCTDSYLTVCRNEAMRQLARNGCTETNGSISYEKTTLRTGYEVESLRRALEGKQADGKKEFVRYMQIFRIIKDKV